jgi:hypothetical protein
LVINPAIKSIQQIKEELTSHVMQKDPSEWSCLMNASTGFFSS